ncbi:MAG TPA: LLM class flavin-dependent oxidoreductase [Candidatus Limnocylindrales bacterium]|nr:LLM class flavin-dependent oxidoreductase [Candidatus Limnocylindrales bacterium]
MGTRFANYQLTRATLMRFSIRLNNDLPAGDYPLLARAAEAAGFDQFWVSDDLFLRSGPVLLTAAALATGRIQIGTCIVNPYTLHPAEIAMMAATLDELSGGRFLLGLSSGAAEFLKWVGITPEKPRTAVIETIRALRRLFAGEAAATEGDFLQWTDEAYLRFKPLRPIPIYLGALSPGMLQTIGVEADGGLPLLLPPEHYDTVLPLIRAGAESAGRALDDIDLAACVWVSISDDRAAAEDALREKIAYYGHAMSPLIWARMGVERADFAPIERAMMVERDPAKAKQMVTPTMLTIGLVGTPADVRPRLQRLVDQGVRHLSFGPPLGPDPLAAIEVIGREILPHFRGR